MASDPWGFVLFIVPTVVRSKFKPNLTINMFDENSIQIVKKMEMNSLNELWSPEKYQSPLQNEKIYKNPLSRG